MADPGKSNSYDWQTVEVHSAPTVWTETCPTNLDEQIEFFNENGFLILPQIITADELKELDDELTRIVVNYKEMPKIREGIQIERNQDPTRQARAFRKIGGLVELSEPFARLMRHPKIIDVIHAIIGPKLQLWREVAMMKPARVGREKPWHQDSVYWPWEPMNLVSATTALDDATPENGCLQVLPGSHKQKLQHFGDELQVDLDQDMHARAVYIPIKAGDTLLFHSMILHASEPNHSDHDRRIVIMAYMSPDLKYTLEGNPPDLPFVSAR